jgi:GTP cyclohydrolase FolE2
LRRREMLEFATFDAVDVRLRAAFGVERWTPVSGKRGEETYTLVGIAHTDEEGTISSRSSRTRCRAKRTICSSAPTSSSW